MLNSFPFIVFLSSMLGFLSGIGVGGGSLLILWLTIVTGMPYQTARIINLLFFLPAAVISSLFRWKDGTLDKTVIFPAIVSGCISAAIFSWIALHLDTSVFQKFFGILLVFTGIRELTWKPKKAQR